jgi:hypothetical protein
MQFFVSKFRWFMLLTGLVTFSLVLVMFTPQESLTRMFGDTASGSTTDIIVPHWASLIALMGIMLIYGAFTSSLRNFVLVIVTINKIIFVVLVLTSSRSYLEHGAGTAVIIDSVMILFYVAYLVLVRTVVPPRPPGSRDDTISVGFGSSGVVAAR